MRIIAGRHKGRRLFAPTWPGLRPTSDKLRETLFNVLAARIVGARLLDGFAGTGAVGIEAISRGAAHVTFVEQDSRALALIARNLAHCRIETGYDISRRSIGGRALDVGRDSYDVIVLDPPYGEDPGPAIAAAAPLLAPGGVLVVEHARRGPAPLAVDGLERVREIVSGASALSFYRPVQAMAGAASDGDRGNE